MLWPCLRKKKIFIARHPSTCPLDGHFFAWECQIQPELMIYIAYMFVYLLIPSSTMHFPLGWVPEIDLLTSLAWDAFVINTLIYSENGRIWFWTCDLKAWWAEPENECLFHWVQFHCSDFHSKNRAIWFRD